MSDIPFTWLLVFLVCALISGLIGFGIATGDAAIIARLMCVWFVLCAVLAVIGRPRPPKNPNRGQAEFFW